MLGASALRAFVPQAPVLQATPEPGNLTAIVGTFVLGALFYSLTAHIAARYVLGDVPVTRALVVGPVPVLVSLLLIEFPAAVILAVGLVADFAAIHVVYRLKFRTAALVTVVHYTVTILLIFVLSYAVAFLSTAPV